MDVKSLPYDHCHAALHKDRQACLDPQQEMQGPAHNINREAAKAAASWLPVATACLFL